MISVSGNVRCSVRAVLVAAGALVVCLLAVASASAVPSPKAFAITPGSFKFSTTGAQAGAHSNWVVSFEFEHNAAGETFNDVKNTVVNLPAGYMANNTAVPTCPYSLLLGRGAGESECPPDTQLGTISLDLTVVHKPVYSTFPVYNMDVSSPGVAAELGFNAIEVTQVLVVRVRPADTGITVTSPSIEDIGEPHDISVTTWGVPASPEHNAERGRNCYQFGAEEGVATCRGGGEEVTTPVIPFLSNPTSCGTFTASMTANSWETPENTTEASTVASPAVGECERVQFHPSIEAQPSTVSAESPTGLEASLVVPQTWENPFTISTSNLMNTRFVLPEGVTVNPSAGSGLGSCSEAQYKSETPASVPGEGCPPESKIGSIEIETPVLNEKILGSVYVATPYANPFPEPGHPGGSLLALYVVAKDPARGIIIKVAGRIEPNPVTGQLTTTFDETPQQPFSKFTLRFFPGATAPLVSPAVCGSYAAQAELTPWSAPLEPRLVSSTPFQITKGVHEGPCPSGGTPPFKPQVISGTNSNSASAYSPFYLRILREDGEQEITRFSTTLPPGLTGNLSGIPFCPDANIEAAKNITGAEEETNPACPQASEIGHTIVSAGVGSVLAQTPGKVYLAGPYHGAPLSIVSITSAKVGPFDLGTVVIRFVLQINPTTAQVEVSANGSDPIPHIIRGIVVHVREIRVYMNRNQFILNPTSCNAMGITNTIDGAGANPANPADQAPVTVNTPFQAADCSSLQFKSSFKVTTSGKTSRANGASLTAKLTVPGALGTQSNIARVKVDLPKQLPSRLTTLQKACPAAQFNANPAGCPAASFIGHARAITPILPVPLEGPAIFVSHGGEEFPSLIVVLQGYGITINLVATTFISKKGITSSTFKTVPDQPVTSFELILPQGKFSALAANGNLCASKLAMPTEFIAQNGAVIHESTPISVTGCAPAIIVLSHKVKGHTVTLEVSVPSAGKLAASANGLSKGSGKIGKAGTVAVKLTLTKAEKSFLSKHRGRKLKAKIHLAFTPKKGAKLKTTTTVLIG
jgi:hypothetical protein